MKFLVGEALFRLLNAYFNFFVGMVLLMGTFLVKAMWADFGESYAELAIIILVVDFSSGYVVSIFSGTCLSKVWLTSYDVLAMLNTD